MWIQILYFQGNKVWMFESEEISKVMVSRSFDLLDDIRVWSLKSYNDGCNIVTISEIMNTWLQLRSVRQNGIENKEKLPSKQVSRVLWENSSYNGNLQFFTLTFF